jgi:hypothetical protein
MEIGIQNIYARSHFVSQNGIQSYDDIKTVLNDDLNRASKGVNLCVQNGK